MAAMIPPGALELSWEAPPECADRAELLGKIEPLALAASGQTAIVAEGRIVTRDDGSGYMLNLAVDDGKRLDRLHLEHADCEALARAASLVVAVAMDPVAVASALEPVVAEPRETVIPPPPLEPWGGAEPEPRPSPRTSAPPAGVVHAAARESIGLALRPEVSVGTGILPGVAGAGLGLALVFTGPATQRRPTGGRWRAEVGAAYWFPRTAEVEDTASGGDVWLASGVVRGCFVAGRSRVRFPLCGAVEVGALGASGFGPGLDVSSGADTWVGAPISGSVVWAATEVLGLYAGVGAVVALRRPGFHLDTLGPVHVAGAVGARGTLGLEMRFF